MILRQPAVRTRGARAEHARGRDRAGRPGRGRRGPPRLARREPPGDRGVHARGQRGGRVVPDRAARRLPPPGPRRPRAAQARRVRRVRPQPRASRSSTPQSRFELQRVLAETAGKPEAYAVHYGLLRSLKQADLHARARGALRPGQRGLLPLHLADPPLSRPPGPPPARRAARRARSPRATHDELIVLAEHCTRTERRAEAAERELIKVKLLTYLEGADRRGRSTPSSSASRTSASSAGSSSCRSRAWSTSPAWPTTTTTSRPETHTLIGRRSGRRYRLGDRIEVRVARVDVDRRELDLVLADQPLSQARRPRAAANSARPARRDRLAAGARRRGATQSGPEGISGPPRPPGPAHRKKKAKGKPKARKAGKKRKR